MLNKQRNAPQERPSPSASKKNHYRVVAMVLLVTTGLIAYLGFGLYSLTLTCWPTRDSGPEWDDADEGKISLFGAAFLIGVLSMIICSLLSIATGNKAILMVLIIGLLILPFILSLVTSLNVFYIDLTDLSEIITGRTRTRVSLMC